MINCLQPYSWEQVVLGVSSNTFVASSASVLQSGPNQTYASDPGFVSLTNNDLRLLPTSAIYTDMPKFTQIPFEMIGLYNDETWTNARVFGPAVANLPASVVSNNSATMNGILAYPQFGTNTTVLAYWGTADGGTNTIAVSAPVSLHAVATLANTGTSPTRVPARPGDTPATMLVPYLRASSTKNCPICPVTPWISTLLLRSSRMLIAHLRR